MFSWITNLFKSPKAIIGMLIDSLDGAEAYIAAEFDTIKARENFTTWTSQKQAERVIDIVQTWLRKAFKV